MKTMTTSMEPIKSYLRNFAERHQISRRETDVIEAILNEHSNIKDIAVQLELSPSTVNNHLNNIYDKTNTSSKAELVSKILAEVVSRYKECNLLRRTPRVLVLDDEPELSEGLAAILQKRGFRVHTSSNTQDAIEKVYELDLDFVVSDIRMPGRDGFDFMSSLKQSHKYNPKVIFITGHSTYNLAQAQDMGAVTIIQKPIDYEVLVKTLLENYIEDSFERESFLNLAKKYPSFSSDKILLEPNQIGFGGIFVPLAYKKGRGVPLDVGARIEVTFSLPTQVRDIPAICEISWVRDVNENGYAPGIGLKFINISEPDIEEVRKYVRERKIRAFIPIGRLT